VGFSSAKELRKEKAVTTPTVQRPAPPPGGAPSVQAAVQRDVGKQLLDIVERSPFTAIQAIAAVYVANGR
jgi:hypothetical protein